MYVHTRTHRHAYIHTDCEWHFSTLSNHHMYLCMMYTHTHACIYLCVCMCSFVLQKYAVIINTDICPCTVCWHLSTFRHKLTLTVTVTVIHHTSKHTYIHTYIHTCTCKHMYSFAYGCTRIYIHTFAHVYIHTYSHAHIHTYIHTYIHEYFGQTVFLGGVGSIFPEYWEILWGIPLRLHYVEAYHGQSTFFM